MADDQSARETESSSDHGDPGRPAGKPKAKRKVTIAEPPADRPALASYQLPPASASSPDLGGARHRHPFGPSARPVVTPAGTTGSSRSGASGSIGPFPDFVDEPESYYATVEDHEDEGKS